MNIFPRWFAAPANTAPHTAVNAAHTPNAAAAAVPPRTVATAQKITHANRGRDRGGEREGEKREGGELEHGEMRVERDDAEVAREEGGDLEGPRFG